MRNKRYGILLIEYNKSILICQSNSLKNLYNDYVNFYKDESVYLVDFKSPIKNSNIGFIFDKDLFYYGLKYE